MPKSTGTLVLDTNLTTCFILPLRGSWIETKGRLLQLIPTSVIVFCLPYVHVVSLQVALRLALLGKVASFEHVYCSYLFL